MKTLACREMKKRSKMAGGISKWPTQLLEGKSMTEVAPLRLFKYVAPGFFRPAGTRLIAGRELTWTDIYGLRPVGIISENLARESWGTPSAALGQRFREFPDMPFHEVVGVVQDVRENGVQEKAPAIVYWPSIMDGTYGPDSFDAERSVTFVVRSNRAGTEGSSARSSKPSGR